MTGRRACAAHIWRGSPPHGRRAEPRAPLPARHPTRTVRRRCRSGRTARRAAAPMTRRRARRSVPAPRHSSGGVREPGGPLAQESKESPRLQAVGQCSRTLETCVPSERCTPAHVWQSNTTQLMLAQSGCAAPQSAQRSLPGAAASAVATWLLVLSAPLGAWPGDASCATAGFLPPATHSIGWWLRHTSATL